MGDLNLRYHDRSCWNCRYIRRYVTGATTSECLLLGRTMGITPTDQSHNLIWWDRERVCDGWKRRPKCWQLYSNADKNPHYFDQYIRRETLLRLRKKLKIA